MYTAGLHITTPDSDELHQLRVDLDSGYRLSDDLLQKPASFSSFYFLTLNNHSFSFYFCGSIVKEALGASPPISGWPLLASTEKVQRGTH